VNTSLTFEDPAFKVEPLYEAWQEFIEEWNDKAPKVCCLIECVLKKIKNKKHTVAVVVRWI